jgi:hypothetical protein
MGPGLVENKGIFSEIRLYIKHHFRHPLMTQSVAMVYTTDGLEKDV